MSDESISPAQRLAASKPAVARASRAKAPPTAVWVCGLKELRQSLRLTIGEAAKGCGLSTPSMYRIECATDLPLTTARRIATFYGKSVEELWPRLVGGLLDEVMRAAG